MSMLLLSLKTINLTVVLLCLLIRGVAVVGVVMVMCSDEVVVLVVIQLW